MSDLAALCARFDGVLLRRDAVPRDVAREASGLVVLSAPYRAGTRALGDATLALARAGVTAVSPELVARAAAPGGGAAGDWLEHDVVAAMWSRWRRPLLRAACGVVVLDGSYMRVSERVRADAAAALEGNQRVWVLADGYGDFGEGVDF